MNYFKKRKLKKLNGFLSGLKKNPIFSQYAEWYSDHVECLEWLASYYEGKCASTPKEILNDMIYNLGHDKCYDSKSASVWVMILYNWIYNNRISGF